MRKSQEERILHSLNGLFLAMDEYFKAEAEGRKDNMGAYQQMARMEVKELREIRNGDNVIPMFK